MLSIRLHAPGEAAPRALALAGPRCMIGKDSGCDVVIPGWKVSRRHAELFVANDRVYIRDLDSTFGTFVNEAKLDSAMALGLEDQVRIGGHALSIEGAGAAPESLPPAIGMDATPSAPPSAEAPAVPPADDLGRLRRLLHERLLEAFDVRRTDTHRMADADLHELSEGAPLTAEKQRQPR